jgi:hypothetical protein
MIGQLVPISSPGLPALMIAAILSDVLFATARSGTSFK